MGMLSDIRRFGLTKALIARFFGRLQRHLKIHVWAVGVRPISLGFAAPEELARAFEFRLVTFEEALNAASNPEYEMSADFVRSAFERGEVCLGAFAGKRLAAYTWRNRDVAPGPDDVWIRIAGSGVVYGYKTFVHSDYRGQRLNTTLGRSYDDGFARQGITREIGYVSLYNLPSLAAYFRDPMHEQIGYAGFAVWGRNFLSFRTRAVRSLMALEHRPPR